MKQLIEHYLEHVKPLMCESVLKLPSTYCTEPMIGLATLLNPSKVIVANSLATHSKKTSKQLVTMLFEPLLSCTPLSTFGKGYDFTIAPTNDHSRHLFIIENGELKPNHSDDVEKWLEQLHFKEKGFVIFLILNRRQLPIEFKPDFEKKLRKMFPLEKVKMLEASKIECIPSVSHSNLIVVDNESSFNFFRLVRNPLNDTVVWANEKYHEQLITMMQKAMIISTDQLSLEYVVRHYFEHLSEIQVLMDKSTMQYDKVGINLEDKALLRAANF